MTPNPMPPHPLRTPFQPCRPPPATETSHPYLGRTQGRVFPPRLQPSAPLRPQGGGRAATPTIGLPPKKGKCHAAEVTRKSGSGLPGSARAPASGRPLPAPTVRPPLPPPTCSRPKGGDSGTAHCRGHSEPPLRRLPLAWPGRGGTPAPPSRSQRRPRTAWRCERVPGDLGALRVWDCRIQAQRRSGWRRGRAGGAPSPLRRRRGGAGRPGSCGLGV